MNKTKITGLVGGALLLCGTQAQAEITWRFDSDDSVSTRFTTLDDASVKQVSGGVTATVQAWSNTGDRSGVGSTSSSTAETYTLDTAYLSVYGGGIGVKNRDASSEYYYPNNVKTLNPNGDNKENNDPEHSTDNDQRYDSVLFSFSSAIDLNSVSIGWSGIDSDITVLAYTGVGAPVMSGKTYAELASSGWGLVEHYSNVASNSDSGSVDKQNVNPGNVKSSYWLIGAYNPLVGNNQGWTLGNDYVKLLALSGDKYIPPPPPHGNPEPGTLLLMGAGLLGLTRIRARRVVRSAA